MKERILSNDEEVMRGAVSRAAVSQFMKREKCWGWGIFVLPCRAIRPEFVATGSPIADVNSNKFVCGQTGRKEVVDVEEALVQLGNEIGVPVLEVLLSHSSRGEVEILHEVDGSSVRNIIFPTPEDERFDEINRSELVFGEAVQNPSSRNPHFSSRKGRMAMPFRTWGVENTILTKLLPPSLERALTGHGDVGKRGRVGVGAGTSFVNGSSPACRYRSRLRLKRSNAPLSPM